MEKNTHTLMRQKHFIPLQSIQASSFDLQLSRCQKATGALNSRNTSATVKLKPRRFSRTPIGHSNLGGVDLVDFNPFWKYDISPTKRDPFLEKEMNHETQMTSFYVDMSVCRGDRAFMSSKKWKLMICYAKSVAAFGSCGDNEKYLPVN